MSGKTGMAAPARRRHTACTHVAPHFRAIVSAESRDAERRACGLRGAQDPRNSGSAELRIRGTQDPRNSGADGAGDVTGEACDVPPLPWGLDGARVVATPHER